MTENNKNENPKWSDWLKFPNPSKDQYLYAPFGPGLYELRNIKTHELVLFGTGKNVAFRMTSLLPPPLGEGTRKNEEKRLYVLNHLNDIEYRTLAIDISEAKEIERRLKSLKNHIFTT